MAGNPDEDIRLAVTAHSLPKSDGQQLVQPGEFADTYDESCPYIRVVGSPPRP